MNARAQKGLELAETVNIQCVGKGVGLWIVPSATGNGQYTVDLNSTSKRCTCPDWEMHRCKCKHVFAVEYTIRRRTRTDTKSNGDSVVTETVTKTKRTTYRQDWPAYNAAQTEEKATFQVLLHDLCKSVPEPEQTFGRPRLPLSDMIFSSAFKIYSTFSGRRFMTDLNEAFDKGYLSKAPHYNSISRYLMEEDLTPILKKLIEQSSLPLQSLETQFAVDASGFSTCKTVTWFNTKYGHDVDNHDWIKLHLMCGVKTNVVTSVEAGDRWGHDHPHFAPLVMDTAMNFHIKEVSADKAYSSRKALQTVKGLGGTPYIPFKSNATDGGNSDIWKRMFHYYNLNREAFLAHYHKRSNVESTFSMIKAKFGAALRSKNDTAMINEALCKVLCHNICCVIQSMHEFGIEPGFWAKWQPVYPA